jgi:uncharacterized membrane protein (DUF485 family)
MTGDSFETIMSSEEYKTLVQAKKKIFWPLFIAILIAYYSFVLIIAFFPSWLATPVGNGPTTIGIYFGLIIIFLTFIITGAYVWYANKKVEPLMAKLHKHFGDIADG